MLVPAAVAAACLPVLAWIYLLAGRGGFWRTDQRLPPSGGTDLAAWPDVVAIVPARNEADVLPQTLPTLLSQDYQGKLRVVLVDDESTDGTAGVAAGLGREPGARAALEVLSGKPRPDGWAGKVWAMSQGLAAASDAEYVLFTDADIGYLPGTLTALVRSARSDRRVLVSQMALLRAQTRPERLLIPAFVYFFAQLYPFRQVNKRGSGTAAAAGGCMLVRRAALAAAGDLDSIKGARIDDVALGGLLKHASPGNDCWLGFSTDVISRRRYDRTAEIWDMVARSAYTQLRYSPVLLAGTVLGMVALYVLPVAAVVAGALLATPALAILGLAAWAIMAASYVPVLRLSGVSPAWAVCLPLIGVLYTAMTISSAVRHHAGRGGEWKGRIINHEQASR